MCEWMREKEAEIRWGRIKREKEGTRSKREGWKLVRLAIISMVIYKILFAPFDYFQVFLSAVTNSWQGGRDRSRRYRCTICIYMHFIYVQIYMYSNLNLIILDKNGNVGNCGCQLFWMLLHVDNFHSRKISLVFHLCERNGNTSVCLDKLTKFLIREFFIDLCQIFQSSY